MADRERYQPKEYLCSMQSGKKPLYRRQNKKAFNYRAGGIAESHFRHDRNTKIVKEFAGSHLPMKQVDRGVDYTPLYKFLLSKVGCEWDDVFSEAISRLDKREPIFHMVKLFPSDTDRGIVRLGESTYYSALTVREGILVRIDPEATLQQVSCTCCTHTFNGEVVVAPADSK